MEERPVCRCGWCVQSDPLYVSYHDREWGVPLHDDRALFELLVLETFQAGLSWRTVLHKRAAFRAAFDGFDWEEVARYGPDKLAALMEDASIIRNRRKIEAAVVNARVFRQIRAERGTFDRYLWGFTGGETVYETGRTSSPLSGAVASDLRRRGMRFTGTTVVYAYLQSAGVVYSHDPGCFLYREG